jgi:hypothetical protein
MSQMLGSQAGIHLMHSSRVSSNKVVQCSCWRSGLQDLGSEVTNFSASTTRPLLAVSVCTVVALTIIAFLLRSEDHCTLNLVFVTLLSNTVVRMTTKE